MTEHKPRRIALVVPRTPRFSRRPSLKALWRESRRFRESFFLAPLPKLGLLQLASCLPAGVEAVYLDENFDAPGAAGRFDVAAISLLTCQAPRAYRLADSFRRKGTHVVLGGMHPTVMTAEALRHGDTVIAGEGEMPWRAFWRDCLRGRPKRLYRADSDGRCSLRGLEAPRYELAMHLPCRSVPVQIGRGCGLACEYCSAEAVHGRRYRHKTADQVAAEIGRLRELRAGDMPEIFFTDDNLLLHRPVLRDTLGAVAPLGVRWAAQMDVAVGRRPDLLRLMQRSGCRRLLLSFDGTSSPGDGGGVARWGDLVSRVQGEGIEVLGMFMLGTDDHESGIFRRVGGFAAERGLRDVQFSVQTPLPGSRLYRRLRRQGRLAEPLRWEEFDFFHVLFRPKRMTRRRLLGGQTALYRQVYSS